MKTIVSLFIALFFSYSVFAQLGGGGSEAFSSNIIPPSPEASALAQYAEVPVSLYTGTPRIGIPLYEIDERDIKVPIGLSYHAGGNKVETYASRTGMGWSLQAGGVVTRVVRGRPDEYGPVGFLKQAEAYDGDIGKMYQGTNEDKYERYDALARGCADTEPDLFYFNFGGYTGKFQFDWEGNIIYGTGDPLIIEPLGLHDTSHDFIDGWLIKTPDGKQYTFSAIEYNKTMLSLSGSGSIEACRLALETLNIPQSWYLTEIRSNRTNTEIHFSYSDYTMAVERWSMEVISHNQFLAPATPSREKQRITIYGKYLSGISTSSGNLTINFVPGVVRKDITLSTVHALGAVEIRDVTGRMVKRWNLGYKNTGSGLFLKSVQETGKRYDPAVAVSAKPPYTFEYYGESMPNPLSFSRDHWGFHNGAGNSTLVPPSLAFRYGDPDPVELSGANREPNFTYTKVGLIKKIHYPTGGTDHFEFAPHDYSFKLDQQMVEEVFIDRSLTARAPEWDTPAGTRHSDIKEFTLIKKTDLALTATYHYMLSGFGGGAYIPKITVKRKSDGSVILQRAYPPSDCADMSDCYKTYTETIYDLPAGQYQLTAEATMGYPAIGRVFATANLKWKEGTGDFHTLTKTGGGVRIAKITSTFGYENPDKVKKYEYKVEKNGEMISSGSLLDAYFIYEKWITHKTGISGYTDSEEQRFDRFSTNRTAMGTTQGSHVGYDQVTVIYGESEENGRSVYKFTSPVDYPDYVNFDLPFPPPRSYEYKRGQLTEQLDYASGSTIPTRRVINTYSYHSEAIPAMKVGWAKPGIGLLGPAYLDRYALGGYTNIIGYSRLTQHKEIHLDAYNEVENRTSFVYNEAGNKLLKKTITTDSEGSEIVTEYKYPDDYGAATDPALYLMVNKHIINTPVEEVNYIEGSPKRLFSAKKIDFDIFHGLALPAVVRTVQTASSIATSSPFMTAQSHYHPVQEYHAYDNHGNQLQSSRPNGLNKSFFWDQQKLNPVAEVHNATKDQVYYNGFENGMATTHRFTGKAAKYQTGKFYIPTSRLPQVAGDYTFSYWVKRGSAEWMRETLEINGYIPGNPINTNNINGYIDEVRLHPSAAMMTSFSYEPLHGLISTCDPNHTTQHYQYDEFGRLIFTTDHKGNIIEGYEYHMK